MKIKPGLGFDHIQVGLGAVGESTPPEDSCFCLFNCCIVGRVAASPRRVRADTSDIRLSIELPKKEIKK